MTNAWSMLDHMEVQQLSPIPGFTVVLCTSPVCQISMVNLLIASPAASASDWAKETFQ